jgi:hypothetical protein
VVWAPPDIPDLEFETAPSVAKRRLLSVPDDEDEDEETFEARVALLPSREQQRQRRIRSQKVQTSLATRAAEEAGTTNNLTLLSRAALDSPVSKQARGLAEQAAPILSQLGKPVGTGGYTGRTAPVPSIEQAEDVFGTLNEFAAPSAIDVVPGLGLLEEVPALAKRASPAAKRLLTQEAGSIRLGEGGDDLEALLQQSMEMLKRDPKAAKAAFAENAAEESRLIKAEQAAEGAQYAEATDLSKRVAQMTGEEPGTVRKRAVSKTAQALDEMKAKLAELRKGEEGSLDLPGPPDRPRPLITKIPSSMDDLTKTVQEEKFLRGEGTAPIPQPEKRPTFIDEALGILGLPQTIMASGDVSAIGRQAQVLGWSNPKQWKEAAESGVRAFASDEAALTARAAVESSPWYDFAKSTGLHVYGWGDDVIDASERVPGFTGLNKSRVAQKANKFRLIKGSERAYATTLNVQGMGVYEKYADSLWNAGERSEKAFKDLAQVINHARGYSDINPGQIVPGFNTFFSGRNMVSRFNVLLDPFNKSGSLFEDSARQLAAKNLASFIGGNAALMGFLGTTGALAGGAWSVDADPRSGDFAKLRIGNTRFDTLAGFGPIARLFARTGAEASDAALGTELSRPYDDWKSGVVQFFRNKEAPVPSLLTDILSGTDFQGRKITMGPERLAEMFTPFLVGEVADAIKNNEGANKLLAVPSAAASLVGGSTGSYLPGVSEERDTAAQAQFGKAYEELLPSQQKAVDASEGVVSARGRQEPSAYQQAKEASLGPIQAEQDKAETAFRAGLLDEKITTRWHNLNEQRKGARATLEAAFLKDFKGDKNEFRKALDRYYDAEVKNEDGSPDWEATEANQQRLLGSYSEEERSWIADYLDTNRSNQSPLRQEYLGYIDQKEAKGYFKEGITAKEREALDKANPQLDVQSWYFGGGLKDKAGPALQSAEAVNLALQKAPDRPVKFGGLDKRAVNENEGTLGAWQEYGQRAANFLNGVQVERDKERIAKAKYKKAFDELTESQKTSVSTHIRNSVLDSAPDLEAYLAWMGQRQTISKDNKKAIETLRYLRQTYGREPEGKDGPIRYHD